MIKYDRLWETMKRRGITQYDLYTHHHVNRSQLDRLRNNKNVEVNTIDRLCNILQCRVEDIMEHFPDDNRFYTDIQLKTLSRRIEVFNMKIIMRRDFMIFQSENHKIVNADRRCLSN